MEAELGSLVEIRPGGSKAPLFCVHARPGHLRVFHNLGRHLDPDRPLYGLQGVLRDDALGLPYLRFEAMAERYVREIRGLQPTGPYSIVGECEGGGLAYEVAQQLHLQGEQVGVLALVDSFGPPEQRRRRSPPKPVSEALNHIRMVAFHMSTLWRTGSGSRREYLTQRLRRLLAASRTEVSGRLGLRSNDFIRRRAFKEAASAYKPIPYEGRVVLVHGTILPPGAVATPGLGWGAVAANLEIVELPVYFGTAMLEPAVSLVAPALGRALEEERARSGAA